MAVEDLQLNKFNDLSMEIDIPQTDINTRITQRLKIRFQWFFAEWYQNALVGVKYHTVVFRKAPDTVAIDDTYKAIITEDPEIDYIEAYEGGFNANKGLKQYDIKFSAMSIHGTPVNFAEGVMRYGE